MLKILSMLKEISKSKDKKAEGQPYTTDMPELESEQESAEQEKKLAPDQELSRLPSSLAQLNVGNNPQKIKMKSGNYCTLCTDLKN